MTCLLQRIFIGLVLSSVLALAGCSRGPKLVEVVGTVTYGGAPPPAAGVVFFAPIEDLSGSGARPASAEFDTDGRFTVKSYSNSTGLKPGRYRVSLQIWKERPKGYNAPGIDLVPRGTTFPELRVEPDQERVEVSYDVPGPSPHGRSQR